MQYNQQHIYKGYYTKYIYSIVRKTWTIQEERNNLHKKEKYNGLKNIHEKHIIIFSCMKFQKRFFGHWACGILVTCGDLSSLNQWSNLCPLQWKHGVLTTRPSGNSYEIKVWENKMLRKVWEKQHFLWKFIGV